MRQKIHKLEDYGTYRFSWKDWLEFCQFIIIKTIIISYLFYDSYKAFIILIPLAFIEYKSMKERKKAYRKRRLTLQFKDMIESLVASLNAGYSLEKAFSDTRRDLQLLYEKDEMIFKELDAIVAGLKVNTPLETLLKDFGVRSGVDDIKNFANVVSVAKRSGGNLIRIIQKTVNSIGDKIAVEEEIKTLIAAKKLEQKIMMIMPYGIIFYLRFSNGDYLQVLYHNTLGVVLMTFFLIVIHLADMWAKKIMEIPV